MNHQQERLRAPGPLTGLSCECGEAMQRTPGGLLVCPRGCGRLREDVTPDAGSGDDLFTTGEE